MQIAEGSGGRLDEATLWETIEGGEFWLCLVVDGEAVKAAVTLQPIHWKTGLREIAINGLTGEDLDTWLHLEAELIARLHALGFPLVSSHARPGWSRIYRKRGHELTHVIMEHRNG